MSSDKARGPGRRVGRLHAVPLDEPVRRPATKDLLIGSAELLFGRHGFDGISLREIASAAGQANSNAVQYHFTDKAGLIGAILEDRMSRTEELRCDMLDRLRGTDGNCPREMLSILWLPLMSWRGIDGSHTFCRFLLQHMLQPNFAQQPLARVRAAAEGDRGDDLSCLEEVTRMLREHCKDLPQAIYSRRLTALSMMFLASVVEYDNACLRDEGTTSPDYDLAPILDMAVAALTASG